MGFEYQFNIAGQIYDMEDVESGGIERSLFDKQSASIGNACSGEMDIALWPKGEIPLNAKIIPYCRMVGEDTWRQLGIFYIYTRKETNGKLEISARDCLVFSDRIWSPPQEAQFPMTMRKVSEMIASELGTTLDNRCKFNDTYMVYYPLTDDTMRMVLQYIASAHVGNWTVTDEGKLLLVPRFGSAPAETNYLVTETGSAIILGGVILLV